MGSNVVKHVVLKLFPPENADASERPCFTVLGASPGCRRVVAGSSPGVDGNHDSGGMEPGITVCMLLHTFACLARAFCLLLDDFCIHWHALAYLLRAW